VKIAIMKSILKKIRRKWHSDILGSESVSSILPLLNEIQKQQQSILSMLTQQRNVRCIAYGLDSYVQNEFLKSNGADFSESYTYQYFSYLKKLLQVRDVEGSYSFVRLGRSHDGGYVMLDDFTNSNIAYSFGISNDVSWDLDMANKGFEVYQYDHTITKLPQNNKHFHYFHTGITGDPACENKDLKTIETILSENRHIGLNNIILKMDVEGAEWSFINHSPIAVLSQFSQMVFELHNLIDINKKDKIIPALEKLNETHQLIYIHANNNCHVFYTGDIMIPSEIEVVYVRRSDYLFKESNAFFPTAMDMKCTNERPEMSLGIWG
jgi:hypothetical protein